MRRTPAAAVAVILTLIFVPRPASAVQGLPKAEDVLPAGEVSKGSLVVTGDGFRYQVKPIYKPIEHPKSKVAYKATVAGILGPAEITLYAYKEAFTGDLDALVKRETEAVTSKGGKVLENMAVRLRIAGTLGSGYRFFAKVDQKLDLVVLGVHEGQAYLFHAETPDQNNPYPNVGSDMMIRGSTFHAAPPAK